MNFSTKKTLLTGVLSLIGFIIIFQSCEKKSDAADLTQSEFHKKAQLVNIFDNEIMPLVTEFKVQSASLDELTKAYKANTSESNLNAAKAQWKNVVRVWKRLDLYDLGGVADSFISFEINRWPTDTERIDANINGTETLDADFIATKGSSVKGIAAIEYLLFTTDENASETYRLRKTDYLVALTENLKVKADELLALWTANKTAFVGALENGITGSQNQVINAMVTLIEEIIISKLGRPLGDTNGGTISIEALEAYRSEFSKEIIQQHLIALERCYKGDFAQTPFRVGFDDFLVLIGSDNLAVDIATQFSHCQQQLDAIDGTLKATLETDTQAVADLKDSFRDLLVLIKVDMANVLGSTITFNDNDGD